MCWRVNCLGLKKLPSDLQPIATNTLKKQGSFQDAFGTLRVLCLIHS